MICLSRDTQTKSTCELQSSIKFHILVHARPALSLGTPHRKFRPSRRRMFYALHRFQTNKIFSTRRRSNALPTFAVVEQALEGPLPGLRPPHLDRQVQVVLGGDEDVELVPLADDAGDEPGAPRRARLRAPQRQTCGKRQRGSGAGVQGEWPTSEPAPPWPVPHAVRGPGTVAVLGVQSTEVLSRIEGPWPPSLQIPPRLKLKFPHFQKICAPRLEPPRVRPWPGPGPRSADPPPLAPAVG